MRDGSSRLTCVVKNRRAARQLALDVLYESEIRGNLPIEALETRESEGWVIPLTGDDQSVTLTDMDEPPDPRSSTT